MKALGRKKCLEKGQKQKRRHSRSKTEEEAVFIKNATGISQDQR